MLSSVASRVILKQAKFNGQTIRLVSSMTPPPNNRNNEEKRRQIHNTPPPRQADVAPEMAEAKPVVAAAAKKEKGIVDRFVITAEVTISKIFPAGFGWQSSSIVAENTFGFAPETMNFALTTGAGDAIGVLGGHCAYYALKKQITGNPKIDMDAEFQTGVLLASAAFCSGTAWQPLVNALQGANLSFAEVFAGTWVGCGLAFYGGLRIGRTILGGYMDHIEEPTYENSKNDASLSVAIGGATGFFVGTDACYLPDQNFLIGALGIQDGTPDLVGCAIAGTSTALGFCTAQSAMNVVYPTGRCWND